MSNRLIKAMSSLIFIIVLKDNCISRICVYMRTIVGEKLDQDFNLGHMLYMTYFE